MSMDTKVKVKKAPAFFVGHGSPMNAIEDNSYTKSLVELGKSIKKPKAILIISAHWITPYNAISIHNNSELIYDMYGFPKELYEIKYPAPNANFLLPDIKNIIPNIKVENRGLDHGAWSVLVHLFPSANIPVMQLSINSNCSMEDYFKIGETIKILREENIMIIGSGNITHNLQDRTLKRDDKISSWAEEFDNFVKKSIENKEYNSLINFQKLHRYGKYAHPTIEHFVPLLYIAGCIYNDDNFRFDYDGFQYGTLSMRNWLLF